MSRHVARPTPELDKWLKEMAATIPNFEACWRAALTKLEREPDAGTPLGDPERGFRGVLFPSDKDVAGNSALRMFPQLLIAYRVDTARIEVFEVKAKQKK